MHIRVLGLPKYGQLGASSRLRIIQYEPVLRTRGISVQVDPLLSDRLLAQRYLSKLYGTRGLVDAYCQRFARLLDRRSHDVLWIEKEALPWTPLWLERTLLGDSPFVLDYDDAVFHTYDKHPSALVRGIFGSRLDGLMARATVVVAGNDYLAQRAVDAGARHVELLPTVVDLDRYEANRVEKSSAADGLPRIVWIGSPSTVRYVQHIRDCLISLASDIPFVLRIIGGGEVKMPGVQTETIPWTVDTEVHSIGTSDVGIMPLIDSSWERGKCGYKLIQYMACGLPVVASAVGVNAEIVESGVNGWLATSPAEWHEALRRCLTDSALRDEMGRAGRMKVEQRYCLQQTGPIMANVLRHAAGS